MLIGVDLGATWTRVAVGDRKGLLTLGCGHRTIRLLPPLDVTEREIDIAVEILESVLKGVK